MTIQETLQGLGLEQKEASIYLALLELGETTVLEIAKKSGTKRPTVYVVLRSLEQKGFASRMLKENKTLFSPQHPKKLIAEAEFRMKELREVVPQLESLFKKEGGRPRVMIYEGKEQLDRAYDEEFIHKGEILFICNIQLATELFPRSFEKILYKTFSPEFRYRELIAETEEAKRYAEKVRGPYREVRFIPKELLPFEADIGIFGDYTLITSVKKEYFTIKIESKEIANAFRTIFELMWQSVKE